MSRADTEESAENGARSLSKVDSEDVPETRPSTESRSEEQSSPSKEVLVSASQTTRKWKRASPKHALHYSLLAILSTVCIYISVDSLAILALPNLHSYKPTKTSPFNLTNAIRHISHLGQKPRWVSTIALEEAMQYVFKELETLVPIAAANGMHLSVHMFRSSPSSFSTSVANYDIRQSYGNVSNVVARLSPVQLAENAEVKPLLINAHVDSAISSPGVNDILVGVSITLDLVRAIASLDPTVDQLQRPIIFLLNGAEEVVLQGSHSFVTQHPWGRSAAAHINFESIGSGRLFHLFRLGPYSSWLAHAYAKSVSVPSGAVTSTDVFETKLIPGETDFRVFNEYGNIPGFDFALLDNGYIYHTIYDDMNSIDLHGVLHGGIMGFELAMGLAGKADAIGAHLSGKGLGYNPLRSVARLLAKKMNMAKEPGSSKVVFFDVLHRFTIVYGEEMSMLINVVVLGATIVVWAIKLTHWSVYDWLSCLRMTLVMIACILAALLSSSFASLVYSKVLMAKMVWYGSQLKALLLFCPPMMVGVFSALLWFLPRRLPMNRFDHMVFALTVLQCAILILMMRASLMSAYIPALMLVVLDSCSVQRTKLAPILKHLQIISMFALITSSNFTTTLSSILPLLGRVGSEHVPHDTIAALIVTSTCLSFVVLPCLPILCQYAPALRRLRTISFLISIWVAVWFILIAPKLNETKSYTPYSQRAPKRLSVLHFHSPQMDPSSVLRISSQDAVDVDLKRIARPLFESDDGVGSLSFLPQFGTLNSTPFESFLPFGKMHSQVILLRSDRKPELAMPTIEVVSEEKVDRGWNISLVLTALESHHVTIRFACGEGSVVKDWSLEASLYDKSGSVWVKHHGSPDMRFWVLLTDVLGDSMTTRPKLPIVITSCRFGYSKSPNDLGMLKFEPWESPASAVSIGVEVII